MSLVQVHRACGQKRGDPDLVNSGSKGHAVQKAHACVHAKPLQSCLAVYDAMDCSPHQAPLSMGFSRQEYWSGLPFPSPGDLPDSWIEPRSLSLLLG